MEDKIFKAFLECHKVTINSRDNVQDAMFFGLKGKNVNGGKYAEDALKNGASYAVVDDDAFKVDERVLVVEDVLETLQELARRYRNTFNIPVIALTGSNGKTTTKELINCLLQEKYLVHCTAGNYNNHIGLPLTILQMPEETEILVLEMGASAEHEISFLCEIARPTHGLITNIGPAHLKGFGSLEGVKRAKSELYHHLAETHGLAFVNADEKYLLELSTDVERRILYSMSGNKKADNTYIVERSFPKIALREDGGDALQMEVDLFGEYNAMNVITALTIASYFDLSPQAQHNALLRFHPRQNRSQIVKTDNNTYLMDAYNANPTSMKNSIKAFANMESALPKILVLGDMKELGEGSPIYHSEIITYLRQYEWDSVYLVGERFSGNERMPGIIYFSSTDKLLSFLQENIMTDSFILLKGSRSMELERVKDILG